MNNNRNKLLIILGMTSTGKTDLALQLAKKFNGELVSCDSRQVYQGLDIGTGKFPGKAVKVKQGRGFWEAGGVKVWMYDVADLRSQYSAADYIRDANKVIDEILKKEKLPIIVGGTGLYIKALTQGLSNLVVPSNQKLRSILEKLSLDKLQDQLQKLSAQKWESLNNSDRQNPRRLIRAIEILSMGFYRTQQPKFTIQKFNTLKIGLTAPRSVLNEKINRRVAEWIKQGIVNEVQNLIQGGVTKLRIKQLGLEYRVVIEYLEGEISKAEMIRKMQVKTRQYAKRQETWFKKEKDIFWFNITNSTWMDQVESRVDSWYYSLNEKKN